MSGITVSLRAGTSPNHRGFGVPLDVAEGTVEVDRATTSVLQMVDTDSPASRIRRAIRT